MVLYDSTVAVDRDLDPRLAALIESANREVAIARALSDVGASQADIDAASAAQTLTLEELDPAGRDEERAQIALIGTVLLYGQLLGFGFWVASGIVEEKASRVVELLLAKISASRLLAGQDLGSACGHREAAGVRGIAWAGRALGRVDLLPARAAGVEWWRGSCWVRRI